MTIQLGSKVRDIVNGLVGIVTGRCEYLTGCVQYIVSPPLDKDGKSQDAHWVDEVRLQILEDPSPEIVAARARLKAKESPAGGPPQTPKRRLT